MNGLVSRTRQANVCPGLYETKVCVGDWGCPPPVHQVRARPSTHHSIKTVAKHSLSVSWSRFVRSQQGRVLDRCARAIMCRRDVYLCTRLLTTVQRAFTVARRYRTRAEQEQLFQ
jgi:hypothetical protein